MPHAQRDLKTSDADLKHCFSVHLEGAKPITVCTNLPTLTREVSHFFRVEDSPRERRNPCRRGCVVFARLGNPIEVERTSHGVGIRKDQALRRIYLTASTQLDLFVTLRKVIREIQINEWEARRFTTIHAAAIKLNDTIIILMGDRGSGKTTLTLDGIDHYGAEVIANDHVFCMSNPLDANDLVFAGLNTLISVKVGTLLHSGRAFPPAYDDDGVDLELWKTRSFAEQRKSSASKYFTFPQIGIPLPKIVSIGSGRLVVVSAAFANSGDESVVTLGSTDILTLIRNTRVEWYFDQRFRTRFLQLPHRPEGEFMHDAIEWASRIAQRSEYVIYKHNGSLAALINLLQRH